MKKLAFLMLALILVGCHKNKSCKINPMVYIYKPPVNGSNYFTKDSQGRAEVNNFQNGCWHHMVFIKGHTKRDYVPTLIDGVG